MECKELMFILVQNQIAFFHLTQNVSTIIGWQIDSSWHFLNAPASSFFVLFYSQQFHSQFFSCVLFLHTWYHFLLTNVSFSIFFVSSQDQTNTSNDKDSTDIIPTLADYFDINLPPDDLQRLHEMTRDTKISPPTKVPTTGDDSEMQLLDYYNSNTVTGTPKPDQYNLDDIFISVKTTKNYHNNRLAMIIKTWFQLAKDQVSILKHVSLRSRVICVNGGAQICHICK